MMNVLTLVGLLYCVSGTVSMPTQEQSIKFLHEKHDEVQHGISDAKLLSEDSPKQAVSMRSLTPAFITAMFIRISVTFAAACASFVLLFVGPYLGPVAVISPDTIIKIFDSAEFVLRLFYL